MCILRSPFIKKLLNKRDLTLDSTGFAISFHLYLLYLLYKQPMDEECILQSKKYHIALSLLKIFHSFFFLLWSVFLLESVYACPLWSQCSQPLACSWDGPGTMGFGSVQRTKAHYSSQTNRSEVERFRSLQRMLKDGKKHSRKHFMKNRSHGH